MRRFWKLALLAAITLAPVSVLNADDAEISRQIVEQLNMKKAEGSLKGFNIGLSVENGVVWLEGHVSDQGQHDLAIDIARRISGVEQVVDGVTVNQPQAPAIQGVLVSAAESVPTPAEPPRELQASPMYADLPRTASAAPLAPQGLRPVPQQAMIPTAEMPNYQPEPAMAQGQMPRAFAPAGTQDFRYASARMQPPVAMQPPAYYPTAAGYASPVRYDNPTLPGYAWPAYAAYPNYAALQYPKQYSPAAWPYIGPFYPYPQVPLGWRKVTMEFNKGWWTVDFKARRHGRW
ncbi:BON domain-containing protein [Blastopirellula sp. JC732]|uniref:BON domain-containing protein n=1 Tax=Blastopirellula sediminis TaxID=2894196 RepID=A0A9X1SFH0_9BACT|nr:BON domain-containing protein [Blastopirellula sediminis]MCC9607716.1 BON domain-containing protein [Blastopirellula sediminis]MCC9627491.1 BON domain-containing protein [Blastopirellula sediminis]